MKRSNYICWWLSKGQFLTLFHGSMPSCDTTKKLIDVIWQKFKEFDKPEIENLMSNFTNTRYDNVGGIRNYILKMARIAWG